MTPSMMLFLHSQHLRTLPAAAAAQSAAAKALATFPSHCLPMSGAQLAAWRVPAAAACQPLLPHMQERRPSGTASGGLRAPSGGQSGPPAAVPAPAGAGSKMIQPHFTSQSWPLLVQFAGRHVNTSTAAADGPLSGSQVGPKGAQPAPAGNLQQKGSG